MNLLKKSIILFLSILIVISVFSVVPFTSYGATNDEFTVITYVAGYFKLVDPLTGQIKLDNKTFDVSEDFDFKAATNHWIEKPNTKVVCKVIENQISDFYSQDDICYISLSTSIVPSSVFARDEKLNVDSFKLNVKMSYVINGQYDFIFDSVLRELSLNCYKLEVNAQSDALNFGSSGFWWFKNYNSNVSEELNYSIFAGMSEEKELTVYVNPDYKLKSVNSLLNISTTLKYEGGEKTANTQISVGSLDIEKEKRSEKIKTSKLKNDVNVAKNKLNQNAQSAVIYDGKLDAFLTTDQQKQIKEVLFVWVSDIFAAASSDYCKQKTQLKDYIYKKLGIKKEYLTDLISTHASFSFVLNTQIGKRTIEFNLELTNYSFGGSPSYAGFGKLNYKMYKENESKYDCQGTGLVALSDMETFTNQLIKIANEQIKSVFMNTVGDDLDKIATYLTEGTMVRVLQDSGIINGSFSDNIYNMLSKPTENYLDIEINCPVDVYIYDSNHSLVGKIINNKIDSNNDVYTFTKGSEKHVYLFDEAYTITIIGNDNGKMDYIVNEKSITGEVLRKLSYNDLTVKTGEAYNAAAPNASLLNSVLYNPIDSENGTYFPKSISMENLFNYNEPSVSYTESCGDNVFFDYYSNGFCHIYGEGKMDDYNIVSGTQGINAPSESPIPKCTQILVDDGVSSIGDNAFRGNTAQYIYIGNDVKTIGTYSLYNCKNLKKIYFGEKVEQIKNWVFSYCDSLNMIEVSENNTNFKAIDGNLLSKNGDIFYKFVNHDVEKFNLPSGVKTIETDAFGDSINLKSVELPNGVQIIKEYAFDGCKGLSNIIIPDTVYSIGESAFGNTKWLSEQDSEFVYAGKVFYKFNSADNSLKNIAINKETTGIADRAFYDCANLESVIVPDSVIRIGDNAFNGCKNLDNLSIGRSVRIIDYGAFGNCRLLKDVYYNGSETDWKDIYINSDNKYLVEATIHFNSTKNTEKVDPTKPDTDSVTQPSVTEHITYETEPTTEPQESYATDYEYNVLSDGTIEITGYSGSESHLIVPSKINGYNVSGIGYDAFAENNNLTSVKLPQGLQSIGFWAFRECQNLTEIDIPDTVTNVDADAFMDTKWYDELPNGIVYAGKIVLKYKGDSPKKIDIADGIVSIAENAFSNCKNLAEVSIPESVIQIGYGAFEGTALYNNSSNWINGVLYVGNNLIEAKNSVSGNYVIKEGTVLIADGAFDECYSINSFSIPQSVRFIGGSAFFGLSINNVVLPENLERIGDYAFICTQISEIKIPDSVTYIGRGAFLDTKMKTVTIPKSVKYIGEEAFGYVEYKAPEKASDYKIYGYSGSDAEKYAKNNDIQFIALSTEIKTGDFDGDGIINTKDRIQFSRYLAKWVGYKPVDEKAFDLNADGVVNTKDRIILSRHLAKWIGYEVLPYKK